ncbi:hypothetical protein GCM10008090_06930 [Arenicella chitinivorans]|uniref:Uncharacterized protein n=1 Tax=Arenicella chitinivorans TaxID=1329800 RepID=A0A918RL28_9GAMM|nr:hypothetical protein [Arenicella chitinivorans]GHA00625.1 hypothetical protein GCM10008090_06930 [Arenicella chitinivorans]
MYSQISNLLKFNLLVSVYLVLGLLFVPIHAQAQSIPASTSFGVEVQDADELTISSSFEMTDNTSLLAAFLGGGSLPVYILVEDDIAGTILYNNTIYVSSLSGVGSVILGNPLTGELTVNLNLKKVDFDFVLDISSLVSGNTTLKVHYRADYVGLLGRSMRYVHEADATVYARAFDGSF